MIMKKILFIIAAIYIIFLILCLIYRNPHKLVFIFGKKGSGKSTIMIKYMIKYLKKGWNVYTDIPDVNIFGVRRMNADDLETFTPLKHSAIFLDEVGLTYDNRNFKNFKKGVNEWYKFQRKYKVVCYCNSQSYDIDLKIRSLVDSMMLCTSVGGVLSIARPIRRKITLTEPMGDSESRIADRLEFAPVWRWKIIYLPRYFKYFNSFSAPERPIIPSEFIDDGIKVVHGRNARKLLMELDKS